MGEIRRASSWLGSPGKDVCSSEAGGSFSLPVLDREDTCGPNSQTSAAHVDVTYFITQLALETASLENFKVFYFTSII